MAVTVVCRYGALYCTNGGLLEGEEVQQEGNPRGCGVFVLHDRSRVRMDRWVEAGGSREDSLLLHDRSRFDSNKWSGFGCRWSGGGTVTNSTFDSNGQVVVVV